MTLHKTMQPKTVLVVNAQVDDFCETDIDGIRTLIDNSERLCDMEFNYENLAPYICALNFKRWKEWCGMNLQRIKFCIFSHESQNLVLFLCSNIRKRKNTAKLMPHPVFYIVQSNELLLLGCIKKNYLYLKCHAIFLFLFLFSLNVSFMKKKKNIFVISKYGKERII